MVLLPIVSLLFLISLFGSGALHDLPIAVVDFDQSALSRRYTRMLDAAAGVKVAYMAASEAEAEALIESGEAQALVVIPRQMQHDIYRKQVVRPHILINSARILNASLLYRDLATVTQTLSTGIELQLLEKQGKSSHEAMQLALPIYYEKHVLFNPYTSYPYYLVSPFNLIMVLIFVVIASLYSLGMERRKGTTAQWLAAAGGSPYVALVGKLLPYTLLYSVWIVLCNLLLFGVLAYPFEGSVVMLTLLSVALIVALQALGCLVLLLLKDLMESMSITAAIATMSFTMGGLTFPLMAMHTPMLVVAHLFPYTHYLKGYVDLMRGADWWLTLPYLAILLVYPTLVLLFTPRLVTLLGKTERYTLGLPTSETQNPPSHA